MSPELANEKDAEPEAPVPLRVEIAGVAIRALTAWAASHRMAAIAAALIVVFLVSLPVAIRLTLAAAGAGQTRDSDGSFRRPG